MPELRRCHVRLTYMRRILSLLATPIAVGLLLVGSGALPRAGAQVRVPTHLLKLQANLRERDPSEYTELLDRAKSAGYDAVLFIDGKLNNYANLPWANTYTKHLQGLRDAVHARGMKFIVATSPIGYCDPLLANDPNLANAYPLRNVQLTAHNHRLVPARNPSLANGSFEQTKNGRFVDWDQKDPGATVDTAVKHGGKAALRLTTNGDAKASARVFTTVDVQPFHQYRITFWAKMSALNANSARLFVMDADTTRNRDLTTQYLSLPKEPLPKDMLRTYFSFGADRTFEWTKMQIAFNSLELNKVRIGFGIDASTSGSMWIDDVEIKSTPTLNLLRRASLPLSLQGTDGTVFSEGRDVAPIVDPLIGKSGFDGLFDTYHDAPEITLPTGSRIREGATVLLSGWHATVTASGQTGCSWHDPQLVALLDRVQRRLQSDVAPDGFLLDIDEVRTGGWEPTDASFGSSGAALAAVVQREVHRLHDIAPTAPVFVWSDMLDPFANAKSTWYYQVKGPLTGSWNGLAKDVVVVNWTAGGSPKGKDSLQHFAKLGNRQILAGFYDHPIAENRAGWVRVSRDVPNIAGAMYTTWQSNYTELEAFAKAWWGAG
jgi:hypothetical protein